MLFGDFFLQAVKLEFCKKTFSISNAVNNKKRSGKPTFLINNMERLFIVLLQ